LAWHIYLLMVLQDFPKNRDHLAAFWDKVRRYALLCRHFFILCCNINNLAERVICWQTVDYWPYITYLNEATCCFPLLASSVFMGLLTCPALPSAHGGPGPSDTVLGGRGYRGNDHRPVPSEYTTLSFCLGLCLGTSNVNAQQIHLQETSALFILTSLSSWMCKPGYASLPLPYARAGNELLVRLCWPNLLLYAFGVV
jgi:hypothetical protein